MMQNKLREYAPFDIIESEFITDQWDSLYTTEINAGNIPNSNAIYPVTQ